MGEIKFISGLLMIALFTIAIVGYTTNFGIDNNAPVNLNQDSEFGLLKSNLSSDLETFKTQSNSSSIAFFSSEVTSGDETTRTGGAFKIGLGQLIGSTKKIMNLGYSKIFGNDVGFGIFLTAITSLFVYIGFRYIWKTWKGGNPD